MTLDHFSIDRRLPVRRNMTCVIRVDHTVHRVHFISAAATAIECGAGFLLTNRREVVTVLRRALSGALPQVPHLTDASIAAATQIVDSLFPELSQDGSRAPAAEVGSAGNDGSRDGSHRGGQDCAAVASSTEGQS